MSRPVDQAKNAEKFLAHTVHEERLDKLLWAMRIRRDAAAPQVPEWEELRTLASEIKEHTLSNLSDYLMRFEARATANGMIVHWARDAHEHNKLSMTSLPDKEWTRWSNPNRC
jgi:L-lactate dehydrogenase complex protein LldF